MGPTFLLQKNLPDVSLFEQPGMHAAHHKVHSYIINVAICSTNPSSEKCHALLSYLNVIGAGKGGSIPVYSITEEVEISEEFRKLPKFLPVMCEKARILM